MANDEARADARGRPAKGPDQVRRLRVNLSLSREEAYVLGEGMRALGGSPSLTTWVRERVVASTLRDLVESRRARKERGDERHFG